MTADSYQTYVWKAIFDYMLHFILEMVQITFFFLRETGSCTSPPFFNNIHNLHKLVNLKPGKEEPWAVQFFKDLNLEHSSFICGLVYRSRSTGNINELIWTELKNILEHEDFQHTNQTRNKQNEKDPLNSKQLN